MAWIFIGIGFIGLSLAISYAWWVKVRVICLRQDIFDNRDKLFDLAVKHNGMDDPAYREAREHLNALAYSAGFLSLPMMEYFAEYAAQADFKPSLFRVKHKDAVMQKHIEECVALCSTRMARYLLLETFDGQVRMLKGRLNGIKKSIEHSVARYTESWVKSDAPDELRSRNF